MTMVSKSITKPQYSKQSGTDIKTEIKTDIQKNETK